MRILKPFFLILMILNKFNLQAQTYDTDAQAFFTATGITETAQKNPVNQLVIDLKAAGIWSKMKALYPFAGTTENMHRYNLKNPAVYNLTFFGGWTHSTSGALPDATTGYADTHLNPASIFSANTSSVHLSFYSRTNNTTTSASMGSWDNSGNRCSMHINWGGITYIDMYNANVDRISTETNNSQGFFLATRTSVNNVSGYKNGALIVSSSATVTGSLPSYPIFLGAVNLAGSPIFFDDRQCAFASIGDGLSANEVLLFNQAVQAYLANVLTGGGAGGSSSPSSPQWITSGNNIYNNNTASVGIGTSAAHMDDANYKLFVAKGIRTEKLKVDVPYTSWPDYVFDKKYKLSSLDEIEKYTKLNKHLPGVPSVQQVVKNGIDVGKNQALLLQKIEELTLIIIEQNKRIIALEKKHKN